MCIDCAVMALNVDVLHFGMLVTVSGGIRNGQDTAKVITPAYSVTTLSTKIHEIVCKPSLRIMQFKANIYSDKDEIAFSAHKESLRIALPTPIKSALLAFNSAVAELLSVIPPVKITGTSITFFIASVNS